MTSGTTVVLPCLGRPFTLGMLYDCRSDRLVPGVTMWDAKTLKNAVLASSQQTSGYEVIAKDSIDAKSLSLGIEAGLEASFLAGLVSVSGSAKYMNDTKSSKYTARVSLKYYSTTRFEQLSMDALGSLQYTQAFDPSMATHVVTGVLYGADAFFVFDQEASNHEDYSKVHGNLQVAVSAIPGIGIGVGGHGSIDLSNDKQKTSKLQCKFYGDMILPQNPTTFEEAVMVYKVLPSQILKDKVEVAKKVWLYPLSKLDNKVSSIMRDISTRLLNDVETLMESLHQLEMQSNDLQKNEVAGVFLAFQEQISCFTSMIATYKKQISKQLGDLLPKVRGGDAAESELKQLLENNRKSPMSYAANSDNRIQKGWLQKKNDEVTTLGAFMQHIHQLKGVSFATSAADLNTYRFGVNHKHVLCFAFNVVSWNDPHLQDMDAYLHGKPVPTKGDFKGQLWYEDKSLMEEIQASIVTFKKLACRTEDVKLVVMDHLETGLDDKESYPRVVLFTDGKQVPLPESIVAPPSEQTPFDSGRPIAFRLSHEYDPQHIYLDGFTAEGKVVLSPTTTGSYTGTHWKPKKLGDGSYAFRCLNHEFDPNHKYLDGFIAKGKVILSKTTTGVYAGTHWKPEKLEDGSYSFRCLGHEYNPKHIYLDGAEGKVILSPTTTGGYTGTHWKIEQVSETDFKKHPPRKVL